jgi:hypothetical protein
MRTYENSSVRLTIYGYPVTDLVTEYYRGSVSLYASGDATQLKIASANPGGRIQFLTGGWVDNSFERMTISTNGNIGISNTNPSYKLDVNGDINLSGNLFHNGETIQISNTPWLEAAEDTLYYGGHVGIGTELPSSRLEVANGDVYISEIDRGIIMKSPDGTCWRGVLDNSGGLHFSPISCPEVSTHTKSVKSSSGISIYPNPADDHLIVSLNGKGMSNVRYSLHRMNGNVLENGKITSDIQQIDISSISEGMYILNVYDRNGNKLAVEKIIKK